MIGEDIYIAGHLGFIARHGAKQGERKDTEPAHQLLALCLKDTNDFVSFHLVTSSILPPHLTLPERDLQPGPGRRSSAIASELFHRKAQGPGPCGHGAVGSCENVRGDLLRDREVKEIQCSRGNLGQYGCRFTAPAVSPEGKG
jgi:hypothetical protein